MSAILCKDRWSAVCDRKWKIGVWSNYGIDATGHSNICAQHISFLAWADKKPTLKELRAAFPDLSYCRVQTREGYRKIKNSDIVITQSTGTYWKHF